MFVRNIGKFALSLQSNAIHHTGTGTYLGMRSYTQVPVPLTN